MKGMIIIARKYKQVHRKEIDFDIKDWEKIERRVAACHTDTTKYLRNIILNTEPSFYDKIEPLHKRLCRESCLTMSTTVVG